MDDKNPVFIGLGLFLISAATLCLEILQIRIFSLMLWYHLSYMVVTISMLGFGASGALVAIFPNLFKERFSAKLSLFAALFSLSTLVVFAILSRFGAIAMVQPGDDIVFSVDRIERIQYVRIFAYYALLVIPYFCAGLCVSLTLSKMIDKVNELYFVNLLGSGLGCLPVIFLIARFGAEGLLILVCVLGVASSIAFGWGSISLKKKVPLLACALILVAALPVSDRLMRFKSSPDKLLSVAVRSKGESNILYSTWSPLCKIDVFDYGFVTSLFQDGDANTGLYKFDETSTEGHTESFYTLPYYIQDHPRVLVIGVGGGRDVWEALHHDPQFVTGVEINPVIVDVCKNRFADITGYMFNREDVRIVTADGRSFTRRSPENYDVIQMTGVDTFAALASGALVLSENYLYTTEALEDYFTHLTDNGVLCIARLLFFPPQPHLRLCATAVEIMRKAGIEHPENHLIVVGSLRQHTFGFTLMKKQPFTDDEISIYEDACQRLGLTAFYTPSSTQDNVFRRFFDAVRTKTEDSFIEEYPFDVSPISDDKPFFYKYNRWSMLWQTLLHLRSPFPKFQVHFIGFFVLVSLLVQTSVLVFFLILLPLFYFRRSGLKVYGRWRMLVYFFSIGVGFMFIEIGFMQKFILFLGHPTYSISVILFSLLLFSGIGSFFANKTGVKSERVIIAISAIMISTIVLAYQALLPALFESFLAHGIITRMVLSVTVVAPLGLFMGAPFPMGLRIAHTVSEHAVPWAWGTNACASVLGSIVSIIIAMIFGFSITLLSAAALYLLAMTVITTIVPGK